MILINVEGIDFIDFDNIVVNKSMITLGGEFTFTVLSDVSFIFPFNGGEVCTVSIDNEVIITGFIDKITRNYSTGSHTATISGRDRTSDIGDSTLTAIDDLKNIDITLKSLIEYVLKNIGTNIQVIDETGGIKSFNKAEDVISVEPGDNAFEFINKWARKRQVLLTSNSEGNLIITKNVNAKESQTFQNIADNALSNNILTGSIDTDISDRFFTYQVVSQPASSSSFTFGPKDTAGTEGLFIDETQRSGRQIVIVSETPSSKPELDDRAKWEADMRRSQSNQIRITVQGHSNDLGQTYKLNKLVTVVDDFLGIDDAFLIEEITYTMDNNSGNLTEFKLVDKDSFTLVLLTPEESEKKKSGGFNFGDN